MKNRPDIDAQAWLAWASRFDGGWTHPDHFENHFCNLPENTTLHPGFDEKACSIESMQSPPTLFYTRGDFEHLRRRPRIAVVGSRDIDFEATRLATTIGKEIARRGGVVVSGGARGTDGIAHRAALDSGGVTICVLPCGIDVASPARHRALFEEIASDGLLVSCYPPGARARKYFYHDRNELIVALSDAVVVVRARKRSGSRITAEHALRMGIPLWVVPGVPDDPHAAGCLELADAGARLYRGSESLELIVGQIAAEGEGEGDTSDSLPGLDPDGREIVQTLGRLGSRATIDQIAAESDRAPRFVASKIMELELWGYCRREPGSPYVHLERRVGRNDASR